MKSVSKLDWKKVDSASGLSSSEALGNNLVTSNVLGFGNDIAGAKSSSMGWRE